MAEMKHTGLTRPEEISQLGKFLGKIRQVQEENTKLVEDNLAAPGETGSELDLVTTSQGITLAESPNLVTSSPKLPGGLGDVIGLGRDKVELASTESVKLNTKSDQLDVSGSDVSLVKSGPKLPNYSKSSSSIGRGTVDLPGSSRGVLSLDDYVAELDDDSQNDLSISSHNLPGERPGDLELVSKSIRGQRDEAILAGLSEQVVGLGEVLDPTLPSHSEVLEVEGTLVLPNHLVKPEVTLDSHSLSNIAVEMPTKVSTLAESGLPTSLVHLAEDEITEGVRLGEDAVQLSVKEGPLELPTDKSVISPSQSVDSLGDTTIRLVGAEDAEFILTNYLSPLHLPGDSVEDLSDITEVLAIDGSLDAEDKFQSDQVKLNKPDEELDLSDYLDELSVTNVSQLSQIKVQGPVVIDPELISKSVKIVGKIEEVELGSSLSDVPDAANQDTYVDFSVDGNELYDSVLARPDSAAPSEDGNELYDSVLVRPDSAAPSEDSRYGYLEELTEDDLYRDNLKLLQSEGSWEEKVGTILSNYANQVVIAPQSVNEFESRLNDEKILNKLVVSTQADKERLPGDNDYRDIIPDIISNVIQGGINKVITNAASRVASLFAKDMSLPMNRPSAEDVENFVRGNIRGLASSSDEDLGDEYNFSTNYLQGEGIKTTLRDLCETDVSSVKSVESLYNTLREGSFITTPDKFTSTTKSGYKAVTLDSNCYWEIVFEPYVGVENGEMSYLPALHEINTRNKAVHGVDTAYSKWIPFTSFDLQKSKVLSKSLGLYDGEVSFPTSMEFINELRLSFADDQYKSWRTYFETCIDAAIYNSEPHNKDYYKSPTSSLTAIDKSNICVSFYKNITFRCIIYVLTPQYSTIQKYDLLLLLKDFTREANGEIDSAGSDFSLNFSIVGENPRDVLVGEKIKPARVPNVDDRGKDYSTVLNSVSNSIIKLI